MSNWWRLPDLGRWHRHILENERLLKDQRENAPVSPYESDKHEEAKAYLSRRKIKVLPLIKESK